MSLYTADTCVLGVMLLNFLHEKQSSSIPRIPYSLHLPNSIFVFDLQILLSLLLYKHIQTMSRFILGSAPNSKNIPSNTSDFSFYLILLLIFFLIYCAFCIIEIIALPTAAILDGELTASFLSLLLNLGPDLCMKIFPVGTFDV